MSLKKAAFSSILSVVLVVAAHAADLPDLTDGFTPPEIAAGGLLGGFPLGGIDSVNLYSGKASISIPIRVVAGRGEGSHALSVPTGYSWTIDKSNSCPSWDLTCSNPDYYDDPVYEEPSPLAGAIHPGTLVGRLAVDSDYAGCGLPQNTKIVIQKTLTRFTLNGGLILRDKLTNGKPQEFGTGLPGSGKCYDDYVSYSRGYEFIAADGSGITFVSDNEIFDERDPVAEIKPTGWLYYPDGRRIRIGGGVFSQIVDRNGNQTTFAYTGGRLTKVIDSINRETTIAYDQLCWVNNDCDIVTWKGAGGVTRTVQVWYDDLANRLDTGYSITSYASLFPGLATSGGLGNFGPPRAVWRVMLPDDSYYEFFYNNYGEVTKAILPTDARIEWDWESGTGTGGGANTNDDLILRRVSERRTYLDSTTATVESKATFSSSESTDCQPLSASPGFVSSVSYSGEISIPSRSESRSYCGAPGKNDYAGPADYPSWKNGRQYKVSSGGVTQLTTWKQYPLTGALKWWTGDHEDDDAPVERPRVDTVETTDASVTPNLVSKQTFKYDIYNNPTDTFAYGWGSTDPDRRTHLEYETSASYVDAPVHLRSLVKKQWTCGAGTGDCLEASAVAKTEFLYDTETLTNRTSPTRHDTTGFGTGYTTRGLLTKVRKWRNLPTSKWIESVVEYDILGNAVKAIDPLGNQITLDYDDDFSNASTPEIPSGEETFAFVTLSTQPLSQSVSSRFDFYAGGPTTYTNVNGVETTYDRSDDFGRIKKVIESANVAATKRQTRFNYQVPNGQSVFYYHTEVYRDQYVFDDENFRSRTFFDRLARAVASHGPDCAMAVTTYNAFGEPETASNPLVGKFLNGTCNGYSQWPGGQPVRTSEYDDRGRVTQVTQPGGAESFTTYDGDRVGVEDAADKTRDLYYDAFGHLVKVIEDPVGLSYITEYSYDTLGNMTQVYQKGNNSTDTQTRTFTYDSLGRQLSADNPEDAGDIDYAYDDKNRLTSKTDARNITTTLFYDALSRLTKKIYSDSTPTAHYCYDGKVFDSSTNLCVTPGTAIPYSVGKMTSSGAEGVNATSFTSFDALGRVLASEQKTWTGTQYNTYTFAYTYNLDGTMASETYPSGKKVDVTYNSDGRLSTAQENGGEMYVVSTDYADHGAVEIQQLGNLLYEQTCFNDRLQPIVRRLGSAEIEDCVNQASDKLHLTFGYSADSTNNGNLTQQAIIANSSNSWTQYYDYDAVNRLAMASEDAAITGSTCPVGATWCREYSYDHFGNRWIAASLDTLHQATPTAQSHFDLATNRLASSTGATYDAAGNMTAHPWITPGAGGGMTYDANNKMTSFTATGVSVDTDYDANNRRVRKVYGSETTISVYDAAGALAAEYTTETISAVAGAYYRTLDHLGSTRMVTDDNGDVVQRRDFFPFGEQIDATASLGGRNQVLDGGSTTTYNAGISVRQQFTGQQRDEETGLDYFWARYYQASLGRFCSVDPASAGALAGDPQSWNAFSYVRGSTLNAVDSDGEELVYVCRRAQEETEDGVRIVRRCSILTAEFFPEQLGCDDPAVQDMNPLACGVCGDGSYSDHPDCGGTSDFALTVGDDGALMEFGSFKKMLNRALTIAIAALKKPGCRQLFVDPLNPRSPDPAVVLRNIVNGSSNYARLRIDTGPVTQPHETNMFNFGRRGRGRGWLGPVITLNEGTFRRETAGSQAGSLLHELAHVYDFNLDITAGSYLSTPDGSHASQNRNFSLIKSRCGLGASTWSQVNLTLP